jgi:hypothetical protein
MEYWKIVSSVKMHGSWRCSKAFQCKLSRIEIVDMKFTSAFPKPLRRNIPAFTKLRFSQSFSTSGSRFPAILG